MFPLTTHAFFKALRFLGAGSVIHAMQHSPREIKSSQLDDEPSATISRGEQDIWKMGALRQKMPVTFWTFLLGTLALCGVPPLSGFYSKDEILATAAEHSTLLFFLATGVAFLTAFYMSRLMLVTFLGTHRSEHADHAHESPKVMVWPLVVLAFPTAVAGFWGIGSFFGRQLAPESIAHHASVLETIFAPFGHAPGAALAGLGATVFGFSFAYSIYANAGKDPLPEKLGFLSLAMRNRFYFDEMYSGLIAITHEAISRLADWFDRWIIAGIGVRGLHGSTEIFGRALRLVQTGNLQTYAFLFAAGLVLVLLLALK
jgi:NADH-quinone oxidoreductase subunit L